MITITETPIIIITETFVLARRHQVHAAQVNSHVVMPWLNTKQILLTSLSAAATSAWLDNKSSTASVIPAFTASMSGVTPYIITYMYKVICWKGQKTDQWYTPAMGADLIRYLAHGHDQKHNEQGIKDCCQLCGGTAVELWNSCGVLQGGKRVKLSSHNRSFVRLQSALGLLPHTCCARL